VGIRRHHPLLCEGVESYMSASASETTMTTSAVAATAPAKINLTLDILGQRDDGYHELRSLVIGVDFRDRIRCSAGVESGVELACNDETLRGVGNLAFRAATELARHIGRDPAVRIDLDKRIPVASGLGGGSSDAATTLRLCNDLWGTGIAPSELAAIGAGVGSDVPLFFSLPAAVMTGRGERVRPVTMQWSGWVLLVVVDARVSTAEVYRSWRPTDAAAVPGGTDDAIIEATTAKEMCGLVSNQLAPAVFRVAPAVAQVYEQLNRAGLGPVRVTGAGSTLYRLFDDQEAAGRAAQKVDDLQLRVATVVVAAPVGPGSMVNEER
jgi:4-diphosphocytidyl-2-C-methyl-D-erythritol kinase